MPKLRVAPLAAAAAAALMGTTGYCVLTNAPGGVPPAPPGFAPPVRLLPDAVVPYPLTDLVVPDATD